VLDVTAHVGSALCYVARGKSYDPSPAANAVEVNARRQWPAHRVLAEYEHGLREAGAAIAAAGGVLSGAAFGAWIHGGDIRLALGMPQAYASDGCEDAIVLLQTNGRVVDTPLVEVHLPDRTVSIGKPVGDRPAARLECDIATLFRLYTGREVNDNSFILTGATRHELVSQQW
jgi:uncharacterized protein (TIGR03083 family)